MNHTFLQSTLRELQVFLHSRRFWGIFAAIVLLIAQFITFQEPILRPVEQTVDDTLAALPPMTRVLLDQLPIPVMLLDDDERVLFVNRSMRDVEPGVNLWVKTLDNIDVEQDEA